LNEKLIQKKFQKIGSFLISGKNVKMKHGLRILTYLRRNCWNDLKEESISKNFNA